MDTPNPVCIAMVVKTMKLVMKHALEVTRTFGLAKHDHEDEAENGENNGSLDDVLNSLENELNDWRSRYSRRETQSSRGYT